MHGERSKAWLPGWISYAMVWAERRRLLSCKNIHHTFQLLWQVLSGGFDFWYPNSADRHAYKQASVYTCFALPRLEPNAPCLSSTILYY